MLAHENESKRLICELDKPMLFDFESVIQVEGNGPLGSKFFYNHFRRIVK